MSKLPPHLIAVIEKKEKKMKELGLDPEWHIKALKAAEARGDDNALIHAVI